MSDMLEIVELNLEALELVSGGSRYALVGHRTDGGEG